MSTNLTRRDILVDVVTACSCCGREGVRWQEFLDHLDDETNAPEAGAPQALRVRIRMNTPKSKDGANASEARLQALLSELAKIGAVTVDGNEVIATGLFSRASAVHNH